MFQRNGSPFITLNSSNQIQLSGDLSLPTSNTQYIRFTNCNIRQGVAGDPAIVYFDFDNDIATGQYRFYIDSNTILHLRPLTTTISNTLEVNTINTNGDNNLVFQRNGTQFFRLDTTNDDITCSKEIIGGNGIKCSTYDSDGDSNIIFKRFDTNYMTFETNRVEINQALHLANSLTLDTADKLTMTPSLEGGINIFDIRNLHPVVDNPMIRFRCGTGAGETIICQMTIDGVSFQRNVIVGTAYELRTNAIDTTTDNDLVISRNNIPFLTLDKFTEDTVEKGAIICSKQLRANGQFRINKLKINQITTGLDNFSDIRLEDNNSIMRFFVGNPNDVNLQIMKTDTLNEILLNRNTKCSQTFYTNTIDTYTDTDLLIKRSGTDVLNIFTYTPTNGPSIIVSAQTDCGISSSWLFGNVFANRTGDTDTEFRGAISGGLSSGKVYMKYLHATETLDFDCVIDNTSQNIIGNIINTAVSDKRLKTNIQDIDANCSDCVKNVKLKTFEFKDEKYHNQDKYGMIAQDLLEHLPKNLKVLLEKINQRKMMIKNI